MEGSILLRLSWCFISLCGFQFQL